MCYVALLTSGGAASVTHAQPATAYYNVPTAQAEINTWATMYDTLRKTGTPAAGAATFSFSDPAMNTPLFSVLAAAKRTVSAVTGVAPCNPVNGTPITEEGGNVTSWMTSNIVATNWAEDPQATSSLIQSATLDPNATLTVSGTSLQAANLSATAVVGAPIAATYASVGSNTLAWIGDFTVASMAHAATLNTNDNARRLLLGLPRTVDESETWTRRWGVEHGKSFGTYQINATFGRFGSLPLIVLAVGMGNQPENFYLLIDGANGYVDGPFVSGTNIDARPLLATHPDAYATGTATSLIRADSGCGIIRADIRFPFAPTPPPGTVPPGLIPAPGTPTGKPTPWSCTGGLTTPPFTAPCVCVTTYNYIPGPAVPCPPQTPPMTSPGLCIVKLEITCTMPAGAACNGGPASPAPVLPPGALPTPTPGVPPNPTTVPGSPGVPVCTESWWYWG